MIFFGFAEVLVLALLAGGTNGNDLITLVQPKDYFASREIRVSIDSMIDIALREPKDGKAQIMQLTALRHLADESDAFKKASNYATNREAIELIAQGKRAQDKAGFAKEYAQRLLDKLDEKKAPEVKLAPLGADAFAWFPADATIVGALDLRGTGQAGADPFKDLIKLMPEQEKSHMYDMIEKFGNVRLERVAFAYNDGAGMRDGRVVLRITGKGSQEGLLATFNMLSGGNMQSKQIKDGSGTPITLLQEPNNRAPTILLVGDTDLLVVASEDRKNPGKLDSLIQDVLDVRSKKKPNAAAGKLKDRLKKIPEKAVGLLVGELPQELKRELGRELGGSPDKVAAFIERTPQGLALTGEGSMANADDASNAVAKIGALRKEGIAELQKAMQQPLPEGAPPIPFQAMINLIESVQVTSNADKVNVRAVAPYGLLNQLPLMLMPRRVEFRK